MFKCLENPFQLLKTIEIMVTEQTLGFRLVTGECQMRSDPEGNDPMRMQDYSGGRVSCC